MKTSIQCLFTAFLLLCACHPFCQTTYEKGRIKTTDGTTLLFEKLTMQSDQSNYINSETKNGSLPNEKIVVIERQTGNEGGKWALWMGLSGLVGSLLGVVQANVETPGAKVKTGTLAGIVIGITAASAGIGYLIGSSKKKYETVYKNPKYGYLPSRTHIGLQCDSRQAGISLKMNF